MHTHAKKAWHPTNSPWYNYLSLDKGIVNMLVAKVVRNNPAYTHIVLGREEELEEEQAYFTRAGGYSSTGYWMEVSGHYNMSILEAAKDFSVRLERGY